MKEMDNLGELYLFLLLVVPAVLLQLYHFVSVNDYIAWKNECFRTTVTHFDFKLMGY